MNRLGGRQQAPPAGIDLRAATPPHLPIVVATVAIRRRTVDVRATNVSALMDEWEGDEARVVDALATVLAGEPFDAAFGDPAELVVWTALDRRGAARQLAQWALDHPEHRLGDRVFAAVQALAEQWS